MEIKPIRTEHDHAAALQRIEQLWGAAQGTSAGDELDVLVTLVEAFEREQYPVDLPNPVDAIKFRLEQEGKGYKALIGIIGQRTRVYEVMRGARPLSLNMIRNLHRKLEIPAEVLIQTGPAKKRRRVRSVRMGKLGSRRSGRRSA
jgi:HTH-type transcriptional regulator/antitoxin HigA